MRGTLVVGPVVGLPGRIIPADAGNTHFQRKPRLKDGDHPRGCGEHVGLTVQPFRVPGSSPRMRGALSPGPRVAVKPGIIPADAGSTPRATFYRGSCPDHPRGCGEHPGVGWHTVAVSGSSPRMRGARSGAFLTAARGGIIPADAGSTRVRRHRCRTGQDHPRGCGEHHFAD